MGALWRWLQTHNFLPGMGGGAIAFPLAAMLHELGHYVAFRALGFPDVVLRFSSVSWPGLGGFLDLLRAGNLEAASEIAQPWQVAVGAAAGPIVTYVTVIVCVLAIRRFGTLSPVLGVGLVSPYAFSWRFRFMHSYFSANHRRPIQTRRLWRCPRAFLCPSCTCPDSPAFCSATGFS